MFSTGPSYNKLKTNLRLVINRLKLLEKKKTEMALKQRKEIADYISSGKVERAKIRVEHIIREDYLVEAMEILEMYCDLLLARFGLVQQMKTIDDGLAEAISSIIWATPRLQSDVQELKVVADQLSFKYGKEYALACRSNNVGTVSEKLCHKLSVQAPPKLTVEKYLIEIANYYNVNYQPDPQVLQADEVFAAQHLVDLGPAPPLPDKNDFKDAVPLPPAALPFQYPAQVPMLQPAFQPPFVYPPGTAAAVGGVAAAAAPGTAEVPSYPAFPQNGGVEKNLMSGFEEGPPPYFPPDLSTPASAQPTTSANVPGAAAAAAATPLPPPASSTSNDVQQRTTTQLDDVKKPPLDLDLPELPGVPTDAPSYGNTPGAKGGDDDDDDIDFDDLTRRFEALKKKK